MLKACERLGWGEHAHCVWVYTSFVMIDRDEQWNKHLYSVFRLFHFFPCVIDAFSYYIIAITKWIHGYTFLTLTFFIYKLSDTYFTPQ